MLFLWDLGSGSDKTQNLWVVTSLNPAGRSDYLTDFPNV